MSQISILHVLVIGSASEYPHSEGQLPSVDNIVSFMKSQERKQCFFYFIDPRHLEVKEDLIIIDSYQKANIPHTIVPRGFNFDTFSQEYKIDSHDEALFIDFANLVSSEYEFISKLGDNKNWSYYCPGCQGSRLNLSETYARKIPNYTIFKDMKIPIEISKAYKADIIKDLNSYIHYLRYLPSCSIDPPPPEWFLEKCGRDKSMWAAMRDSAYNVLSIWFDRNGVELYDCHSYDKWYKLVSDAISKSGV